MKKLVVAATLYMLCSSAVFSQASTTSFSPAKKFQTLIGVWEIVGEQDSGGSLEIIDSSTIVLRFMGEEKKLLRYNIDFTKSPCWFDFSTKDSASVVTVKSLFEFVNDDMLKWQVFMNEDRTNHFSSSRGELLYLKRVRSKPNSAYYTDNK